MCAKFDIALKEQTRRNQGGHPPANSVEQVIHQWTYDGEIGLRYTGFNHQTIQAGVQASYDHNFDTYFTFNNNDPAEHIPKTTLVDQDTAAVGFYLDDTIQVTKWLKLIEGVRIDENGRLHGDKWVPGARSAIIVEPTSNWTSPFACARASSVLALDARGDCEFLKSLSVM